MTGPDDSIVLVPGPWTHRTVAANGIRLHVAEAGSGPLVVLLHGMPTFWWTWAAQLTALAEAGFRAVAVDLRGYGSSDKPPRGYDASTLAADVAHLVSALGEQNAVIVGNDVGGLLAWTVAARHRAVVRALAVLGAPHPLAMRDSLAGLRSPQRHASAYALRYFQLPRLGERLLTRDDTFIRGLFDTWSGPRWRGTPDYVASVERYAEAMRIPPVAHCCLEFYRWIVRSAARPDGRAYRASMRPLISPPVLQIHGDFDGCILPESARASEAYVAGDFQWRLLTGVGHFPQHEASRDVSAELVRWAAANS